MDEAAFFYGEDYEVNDAEIYDAALPRLLPGGQIVLASSPWSKSGLVWEKFKANFGKPTTAVVVKAPSLIMHPTPELERAYTSMLKDDPDNAHREYDAEFMSADAERFFSEAAIEQSIDESIILPSDVRSGEKVRFGADFGFSVDSSALVGFAERKGKWSVVSLVERRPLAGLPLVPSEVVEEFAVEIKRCGGNAVTADEWYRQTIQEHLSKYMLPLFPAPTPPAVGFVLVRTLMNQGKLRIPNHPRLLTQLRKVKSTIKPGGVVTIQQPRAKEGGHGDIVSALVCALYGVSASSTYPEDPPKTVMERLVKEEKAAQVTRLKENAARNAKNNKSMLGFIKRTLGRKAWQSLTR